MSVSMPCSKRRSCRTCCRVLCNSQTLKTRQIRHRFIRRRSALAGCYAIEVDHRLKVALQPDCVLDYRRESRIRGNNLVLPFDVAQDYLRENWYHSARRCLELFFHSTAYDTRERGPRATTFLLTSCHRYCMAVIWMV